MLILGLGAAIIAAFCWAVSAGLYRKGSETISPLTANLLRMIPVLGVLALVGLLLNIYPYSYSLTVIDLVLIVTSSLFAFVIGDWLYLLALQHIGVSRATPITATYPLFVLIIQVVFLSEPLNPLLLPAATGICIGIILLGSQIDPSTVATVAKSHLRLWVGAVAALATAISWSVSIVLLSEVLKTTDMILVAVLRLAIGLLVLTPLVMGRQVGRQEFKVNRRTWLLLGSGGIIALGVGYIAFAVALQIAGTTPATILSSLTPLFATVIAWRQIHERISWRTIIGVILCMAGIFLTAIASSL
ncbi:MAG: DMT family transporter [Promethearchaeota archaeon]